MHLQLTQVQADELTESTAVFGLRPFERACAPSHAPLTIVVSIALSATSPRVRPSKIPAVELARVSRPLSVAVSLVVSFAPVRRSSDLPTAHLDPRSRTVPACRERWGAHLESVLGATPREFESRILHHL